jgi:hypothetical protein
MRNYPLRNPPRPYHCRLRRHDEQIGKPASDHPEIRQRNRRAAQLFRGYRARDCVSTQAVEAGPQVPYAPLCDIAQHGNDEAAALGIDGDAEIDALDQAPFSRAGTR